MLEIMRAASLEVSTGQRDSARALFEKSIGIYESLGDSGGITVTSTDLAMITYSGRDESRLCSGCTINASGFRWIG